MFYLSVKHNGRQTDVFIMNLFHVTNWIFPKCICFHHKTVRIVGRLEEDLSFPVV